MEQFVAPPGPGGVERGQELVGQAGLSWLSTGSIGSRAVRITSPQTPRTPGSTAVSSKVNRTNGNVGVAAKPTFPLGQFRDSDSGAGDAVEGEGSGFAGVASALRGENTAETSLLPEFSPHYREKVPSGVHYRVMCQDCRRVSHGFPPEAYRSGGGVETLFVHQVRAGQCVIGWGVVDDIRPSSTNPAKRSVVIEGGFEFDHGANDAVMIMNPLRDEWTLRAIPGSKWIGRDAPTTEETADTDAATADASHRRAGLCRVARPVGTGDRSARRQDRGVDGRAPAPALLHRRGQAIHAARPCPAWPRCRPRADREPGVPQDYVTLADVARERRRGGPPRSAK
ncbi:hypothetical protein [Kutzneria sp. NPDC052558]|uniref:hypothetical protein n=1 Tax=Kutzneria sp. NPDC052558 TaxID=3364121 RepID=UPI0037C87595